VGKNNIKYTIEKVRVITKEFGFELISTEYINTHQNLILRDKNLYLYFSRLSDLTRGKKPVFAQKSNPYSIYNIKLFCKINNKQFELLSDIYESASKNLKWKCLKEGCGDEFEACWHNVYNGQGCGVCHGKQIGLSNCLAIKRPDLILEWHSIKNGNLTPWNFTSGSKEKVWWQCKNGHEWDALIHTRSNIINGTGCPYCVESKLQEKTRLYINECGYDTLHEKECTLNPRNIICPPNKSDKQRRKGILRYDNEIIIGNKHLFIEVHGQQHDSEDNIFNIKASKKHNTTPKEELEYLINRDNFKKQYVYMQGENYYYLALWYYDFDKEDTYKQLINKKIGEILNDKELKLNIAC